MGEDREKIRLGFYGGVRGVTGSCFLLEVGADKLLVDCGLFQGRRMCHGRNMDPFGFAPEDVDAVVVTHAHLDHTGRLPVLVKNGFKGTVYMTAPTKDLGKWVLEDAQRVMEENAKRCGDPQPYSRDDVSAVMRSIRGMTYKTTFYPISQVEASFHDAGHILGSAFITMKIKRKNQKDLHLVFSGDVGNDNVPILPATAEIDKVDAVVVESTYGNRDHEQVKTRSKKLERVINKVIGRGGTLMIPAFSIERTQEVLHEIDLLLAEKKIPQAPYYIDSPLAVHVTDVYRKHQSYLEVDKLPGGRTSLFAFPGLKTTLSREQSKQINRDNRPKIIIAGSGMMTGGRILHHLRRYLPDRKNGLLVVGYQADGTTGRKILDGASEVEIFNDTVKVRSSVDAIGAFSAHGDRAKLVRWLSSGSEEPKQVYLVHGDPEVKREFKAYIQERMNSEVLIPTFKETIEF